MPGDDFGGFESFSARRRGPAASSGCRQPGRVHRARSEPDFEKLSDDGAASDKTAEFRQRVANGEALEDILFEAFARRARGAQARVGAVRLFDVQLMGGIVLHEGDIAEMKTGEGKTFVASDAALPERARPAQNVHLVTVNDYLAKRDAGVEPRPSSTRLGRDRRLRSRT